MVDMMPGRQKEAADAAKIVVGPTEDTVLALLELLVEPLLPSRAAARENPSPSQEEAVAKQMHAVVLLYNYYHRKCRPGLELLEFDSFCKLAVVLKPNLYSYMELMKLENYDELNDLDKQLSLTEKMTMEACDISTSLDASKDIPVTEGWPISKVAIFLVDAQKENCYLLHSVITQGVWSLIEKEVNCPRKCSEPPPDARVGKRRITRKPQKVNQDVDESNLQQLAFSAVKDAFGFTQSDLKILEDHVVYSLSKEKSAARFYIMQCMHSNQDASVVPIRDAVESLRAPLVRKDSHGWTTTSAVEYFHLLPYADIVSDWLSREKLQNASRDCETGLKAEKQNSSQGPEEPRETVVYKKRSSSQKSCTLGDNLGSNASNADADHSRQDNNEFVVTASLDNIAADEPSLAGSLDDDRSRNSADEDHGNDQKSMINLGNSDRLAKTNFSLNDGKSRNFHSEDHVDDQKTMITLEESHLPDKTNGTIVPTHIIEESANTYERRIKEFSENNVAKAVMSDQFVEQDLALVAHDSSSKQVDKVLLTIASKEKLLSQAALKVLRRKREMLSHQLRDIEDEIALCDRNIQTILSGGEDNLAVKLDAVIEGCNDMNLSSAASLKEGRFQHFQDEDFPQYTKRKRLSEANLCLQSSCQMSKSSEEYYIADHSLWDFRASVVVLSDLPEELDSICYVNNWILPRYFVSAADGGFRANVTLKGTDFECSSEGDMCASPREARESAAMQMLDKLRKLAAQS